MSIRVGFRRPIVVLSFLALAGACATGTADSTRGNGWTLVQPFHHPLSGVGGGAIVGSLLVPDDGENQIATRALLQALQNQQLSIVKPQLGVEATIPPRTAWETDIAPVPADVITLYNRTFPSLTLPPAYYGIAYRGMHDTAGNQFRFNVSALLYQRGAISDWSRVADRNYSGQFFVTRLVDGIKEELKRNELPHP